MKSFLKQKRGFAHVGILALLLALVGLGTAVVVVQNSTEFSNFAGSTTQNYSGTVLAVKPCVRGNLCYRLRVNKIGGSYFLLASKGGGVSSFCPKGVSKEECSKNVNLQKYVGKDVTLTGILVKSIGSTYIFVLSVGSGGNVSSDQMSVTEIGKISKITEVPPPVEPIVGQPVPVGSTTTAIVPDQQSCLRDSAGKIVCPIIKGISCPSGSRLVQPEMADACGCTVPPRCVPPGSTCFPRPACLDAKPHACLIAEPVEGWCPPQKCVARPACLDAKTPCNVSPLPPGVTYCPTKCITRPACADGIADASGNKVYCDPGPGVQWCPTPPPPPPPLPVQFMLTTDDGRSYPLVVKPFVCPVGMMCTHQLRDELNLELFVGKTVLVEGVMKMDRPACLDAKPPCKVPERGWWPLPGGLIFEVKRVQVAQMITALTLKDYLTGVSGKYASEQVFRFKDLKPCDPSTFFCPLPREGSELNTDLVFVRSSLDSLESRLGGVVSATGTVYLVGGVDYFLNVTKVLMTHRECVNKACVEVASPGADNCAVSSQCVEGVSPNYCSSDAQCRKQCKSPQTCPMARCVKNACVFGDADL